jgi:hypothetical protein
LIANNKELGGYQVLEKSEKYEATVLGRGIAVLMDNPN